MDMRCKSIHGDYYAQVFANDELFAVAYPIVKKSDAHHPLDHFIRDYGVMSELIMDGSGEQSGKHTKFQAKMKQYHIKTKKSEKECPNQNLAEGTIREVWKKWFR